MVVTLLKKTVCTIRIYIYTNGPCLIDLYIYIYIFFKMCFSQLENKIKKNGKIWGLQKVSRLTI